jgi:hypothetical protein
MAGEHTETQAHDGDSNDTSNGASHVSRDTLLARDRAAFLAGELGDADEKPAKVDDKKPPAKSKPVDADDDDDDDLDDEDDEDLDDQDDEDDVEETADEADDDSDLDEEDEDADADKDKGDDAETSKRLEKVRRTDQRLRERREQEFAKRDRELGDREGKIAKTIEHWTPRIEAAEKFEKLKARAKHSAVELLGELGVNLEEDGEDLAREIYAHSKKGAADPKNKDAAARSRKEREQADTIRKLQERLDARDKAEEEQKMTAEQRKAVDHHLDRFSALAKKSEKFPLAKTYLAKNAEAARADLEVVAGRVAQQLGRMPEPKEVMKAFEKDRRRVLRAHGIDPKSRGAASSSAASSTDSKAAKTTAKTGDKTTAEKKTEKPFTKDDFIRGNYD